MNLFNTLRILIGITIMTNINAAPTFNKPVYTLSYEVYGTGAEIRLNDIPAVYSTSQGKTKTSRPVPESIIDGVNTIQINAFTLKKDDNEFRDGSYVDVTLSVNNENAPLGNSTPILHLKINPNLEGDFLSQTKNPINISKPEIISNEERLKSARIEVKIDSPFPRWSWQDGKTIENNQENFDTLLEKYKEIHQALNRKDNQHVYQLYDATASEFSAAYNRSDVSDGHSIISTGELMNDSDWKLGSIDLILTKREYELDIYANGKLARIIDNFKKESLITYINPADRLTSFQKFAFYKNNNNEWVMIR